MTTADFNSFLLEQSKRDLRTAEQIEEIRTDVLAMHKIRHDTLDNLSVTIGELRIDRAKTDDNLAELSLLVKELVLGLKGNGFGASGVVAQVADHEQRIKGFEKTRDNASGMKILIGWGVGAIGAAVALKGLLK